MDRRTRNVFAVVLVAILLLTGGAVLVLGGPGSGDPPGTMTIEGVVVAVTATSLTDVCCFTLRTVDGEVYEFELTGLENGAQFPPGHLTEHQATAQRVRVWYRAAVDSLLRAIRIEDAP